MPKRNVILLAAPLSGARPLAEALVKDGWNTGGLAKPDFRDPSVSSFENDMLVSANQIVLNGTKVPTEWNADLDLNWVSRFRLEAVSDVPHEWVDAIFVNFSKSPCLLKDPQLLWTFQKWWPIWQPKEMPEELRARVCVLFKFPVDFVASVLRGVEMNWWPQIPKDPDYLVQLWTEWYQNILKFDDGSFLYFHSTDQLCTDEGIARVNDVLGSSLNHLDGSAVRSRIRRDTASMPKETWQLYDRLYFKTLRAKS